METTPSNTPPIQQEEEDRDVSIQTNNPNLVLNQITSIRQEGDGDGDGDGSTLNQTHNPTGVMSDPTSEDNPTAENETPTDSQNMVPELPIDLIAEIFKPLPIKTLCRFKCVCKPWRNLLTNSIFVKCHLQRNRSMFQSDLKTNTRIVLARYCDSLLSAVDSDINNVMQVEEINFPLVKNLPYYVKGHSDGLLCLVINDGGEGMLVVYNPSIQQYRRLPNPADFRSTREAIGIGFDKKIEDYKVVRVPSCYCMLKVPGYKPKVEVLELKTNTWRQLPDEVTPSHFVEHIFQSTEVNGGLYWLTEDERKRKSLILRFDLVEEKFKVLEPPPPKKSGWNVPWIGPLKDMLCVVHTTGLSEIHVWATNDDKTWRKIMTNIKYPDPPPINDCRYMPLCYTEEGAVLMSIKGEAFLTFDNRTKEFATVHIQDAKNWLQETMYCDSLVSPGVGVHPTEPAASSGTAINHLTVEDEEEEDREGAENNSSILQMMSNLKKELANLLACTVGHGRPAQE